MAINREKVLDAAQKFLEKKKYDKAVAEFQKILQEDPNDARVLLKVGDAQSKMEQYPQAIETYERVGRHYVQQGFSTKAIFLYKQIREIIAKHAPQLEDRYGHIAPKLAELYQQLGLTSDAMAALDEVASRLQRQQRDAEAIEVLRKIIELDPTNPLPHLRLAEAYSRVRDADAAVTEFGVAASLLVKLGRRDDALKVFERLLHHKPDPSNARICAELYLERAQPADGMQALAKLQICFQANPKDLDTLALLARAFGTIGQATKGIEVQKEMARIAREQGKADLFKQLVDKLLRVAPNDEGVKALLASGPDVVTGTSIAPEPPAAPVIKSAQRESSYDSVVDSQEVEDVLDDGSDGAEAFELKSDQPPPPSAPRYDQPSPRPLSARPGSPPSSRADSESAAPELIIGDHGEEQEQRLYLDDESLERPDLLATVRQLVADASAFRRVRLYAKATETLREAIELAPKEREPREVLRDILLETRQYHEAVTEMLSIATNFVDTGDVEAAARTLYDALSVEPGSARATEMLRGLGYEPGGEAEPQSGGPPSASSTDTMQGSPGAEEYRLEEPLPSYELEDTGGARQELGTDEPFGGPHEPPLPSFPLDPPESEAQFDLVQRPRRDPDASEGFAAQPRGSQGPSATDIEEALEEVDFYASRGLYDDARAIVTEQLTLHPNHMLLNERLAELDSQEHAARGGSGTRVVPKSTGVDRSFDIAASLDALENLDTASGLPEGFAGADKQVDVEEVFAKFKEGVAKQVSADDAQSHYDLGVAYKEMGLHDDALREFDIAARDPKRECVCRSMIGMIQLERGQINEAIEAFLVGLRAQVKTPEQETVLSYEVGAAYEATKRPKDALTYFQRVMRRDSTYRDVQERVRRLTGSGPKAPRAAAVGADDEFDRAFDEIIGGGKLP